MRKIRGFTLVEMLIVIAVIGVLAVAVLSAINPVEQMRKARDTRRRSSAAELLNAIERYYTTNESNPEAFEDNVLIGGDDTCDSATANAIDADSLADLVSSSELKPEFVERITADESNYLYVGIDTTTELAAVCYQIESAANIEKYGATGLAIACGEDPYYVCLPE